MSQIRRSQTLGDAPFSSCFPQHLAIALDRLIEQGLPRRGSPTIAGEEEEELRRRNREAEKRNSMGYRHEFRECHD